MSSRVTLRSLFVIVAFSLVFPIMAAVAPDIKEVPPDPCAGMDPDVCLVATSISTTTTVNYTLCTDSFGCPACGLSMDLKSSICYRLYGQSGYCTCKPASVYIDPKYGVVWPRCKTTGSCAKQH